MTTNELYQTAFNTLIDSYGFSARDILESFFNTMSSDELEKHLGYFCSDNDLDIENL